MSTFLFDFIDQLDKKWKEVDLLLAEAKKYEASNSDLFNAICRSVTVLIVAHLEGFIKDLVKAIVRDVNQSCSFKVLPIAMKRTYCQKYLGARPDRDRSYNIKIENLINKFCEVDCKISYEPFLLEGNKNPKPDVIKSVFKNFGVEDVFLHLHDSRLDSVFEGAKIKLKEVIAIEKEYMKTEVLSFPYQCTTERLSLSKTNKGKNSRRTLWQSFLDDINRKRHEVAHGNEFENGESVQVLEDRKDMVIYLQLGLIQLLASKVTVDSAN